MIHYMKKKILNTHLTLEARSHIEYSLNENQTITQIAKDLQRDRSNIGREIIKHRHTVFPSSYGRKHPCLIYDFCEIKNYECYKFCKKIEVNLCERLTFSPHVCNGCTKKNGCRHVKYYYTANDANNEYISKWKNSRNDLHYSQLELEILNNDFYGLVLNTKSIYHSLIVINSRGFSFNIKSIYRQIKNNRLKLKSYNLPRTRKNKSETINKNYKKNITDHTYEDYNFYKLNNLTSCEIQMDTVEGAKINNAPVILTLEIVKINFLFMFKIDSQTSECVVTKLHEFKEVLSPRIFDILFETLLTDNGKEFSDIEGITKLSDHLNLFYCHPYSSYEKGSIENNHELIRRVIPKGVSLKEYSQKDFDLLCSHVNSLYRESLDGKCPFDLIENYVNKNTLDKLNIIKIDDNQVMLIPELLGPKNIDNIKKHLDYSDLKKAHITFIE